MCGIAGVFHNGQALTQPQLEAMAQPLINRGPDGVGYYQNNKLALIHRRLSIIDLEGGKQPIFNEDETLAIVCNGELYDYQEHRRVLESKGHRFRTQSDSEVVLHLYEEYGVDCLSKMNGMFAFVIANLQTGELFVARDRFGQKPFFYTTEKGKFAFASGPQSLQSLDWVSSDLNHSSLQNYFDLTVIPSPGSIFQSISKLEPGHYGIWKNHQFETHSYWQYKHNNSFSGSFEEAQEELRLLMDRAVRRRLVADVPVACFLSGGVDSSVITALAAEQHPNMQTFSVAFPEEEFDERTYAKRVAEHFSCKHHSLEVDASDFSYLRRLVNCYEEPFADSSMLPTGLLSQFTRSSATVALSGDAADELFGGYYRYLVMQKLAKYDFVPKNVRKGLAGAISPFCRSEIERSFSGKLKRLMRSYSKTGLERYHAVFAKDDYGDSRFTSNMQKGPGSLFSFEQKFNEQGDFAHELMALDVNTYLHNDILVKVDRASMGHSLEVRSPFLDVEVAEFAMSLPLSYKMKGNERKSILREAYRHKLPAEILDRPKMGFGLPVAHWFRNQWRGQVVELMNESPILKEFLSEEYRKSLLERHLSGKEDCNAVLFSCVVLALWSEKLIK